MKPRALLVLLIHCAPLCLTSHTLALTPIQWDGSAQTLLIDSLCRVRVDSLGQGRRAPTEFFSPGAWLNAPSLPVNSGYSEHERWVRFDLHNSAPDGQCWLWLRRTIPDTVELYRIRTDGLSVVARGGRTSALEWPLITVGGGIAMVLPLQAHSRSNFALRIKSRDVLSVSLLLRSEAAALQRLAQEYAWLGLYGGAVVAIALFNLGVGIAARYRSSLDYSLYIAAAGMFYASVLGVWSLWPAVPPAIGAMMVPLWVGVALLSGARFSERFLQAGSIFPSSRLLFALFSWLGALIAGISFIDEGSWAARAASVVAPLFVLYTLGVSLLLVRERRRAAVYYAIAVLLPTLGIVLNGLRNFGIIADGLWSSRGNLIGSVMEFSVLSVALVQRIAQGERERMRAQREADAAQKLAVESRLRTLQAQIHPHFLFNALNSLVSLIAEDGRRAEKMVGDLARIFRSSLEASVRKTVRLSEELAMVEAYLSIQKVRLGQRLVYTITTEGPVEKLWVVGQLIQPLVENSIKHAIAPLIGGGHIEVQCRVVEQELVVRVWDSGPGFNNLETAVGAGHGLANVAERLRLTYAGAASLQLSNQQGAVVTLHLPRREQA